MGGDPHRYLSKVKRSDINDGQYPSTPEYTHELQQPKKEKALKSALNRILKRILRCTRGPKSEHQNNSKPDSYSETPEPTKLPPKEKGQTWSQKISTQKQCPLLNRIPIEVRQQIYKELFSNLAPKWHLQWPSEAFQPKGDGKGEGVKKQTWCHSPCPKRYLPNNSHQWCLSNEEYFLFPDQSTGIENAILFTCRQAYIESSTFLYSTLVFGLDSPLALRKLTSNLSTPLLHSITSLDLEWEMNITPDPPTPVPFAAKAFTRGKKNLETSPQPQTSFAAHLAYKRLWELLASFEGLKRLRVRIYTHHDEYSHPTFGFTQGFERLWLDPMVRFEGLETFCLAINEPFFGMFEEERERMGWTFRISNIGDGLQWSQDDDDDDDDNEGSDNIDF